MENTYGPLVTILGAANVRRDDEARRTYGADGTRRHHPPDVVVFPANTAEVAAIASIFFSAWRAPM